MALTHIFIRKAYFIVKIGLQTHTEHTYSSTLSLYQMTTIQHFRHSIVMLCCVADGYHIHTLASEFQVDSKRNETNVHFTIFNEAINTRYHPRPGTVAQQLEENERHKWK